METAHFPAADSYARGTGHATRKLAPAPPPPARPGCGASVTCLHSAASGRNFIVQGAVGGGDAQHVTVGCCSRTVPPRVELLAERHDRSTHKRSSPTAAGLNRPDQLHPRTRRVYAYAHAVRHCCAACFDGPSGFPQSGFGRAYARRCLSGKGWASSGYHPDSRWSFPATCQDVACDTVCAGVGPVSLPVPPLGHRSRHTRQERQGGTP